MQRRSLWIVCEGKRQRVAGRTVDFAVSADGSYLAIEENLESSGIGRTKEVLVSLKPPFEERSRKLSYPESLYSTCGTIVSVQYGNAQSFDLISSRVLELPPYKDFRCSFDQKTIAGWAEKDDEDRLKRLQSGLDASEITLTVKHHGMERSVTVKDKVFALSPNGEYLAYFVPYPRTPDPNSGPDLCVDGPDGNSSCILGFGHSLSVSDTGDVIYAADEIGVKFWRPGLPRTILLEKGEDSGRPQWITPQTADAAHAWSIRRSTLP